MPNPLPMCVIVAKAVEAQHKMVQLHKKWISPEVLMKLLKQGDKMPIDMTESEFNRAMARAFKGFEVRTSNYIITRRQLHSRKEGKKFMYYGYLLKTNADDKVNDTDWINKCYYDYDELINAVYPRVTRSIKDANTLKFMKETLSSVTPPTPQKNCVVRTRNMTKRKASETLNEKDDCNNSNNKKKQYHTCNTCDIADEQNIQNELNFSTWDKWNSPEALYLFLGRERANEIKLRYNKKSFDCSSHVEYYGTSNSFFPEYCITTHIEKQIVRLRHAYLNFDSWRDVVEDGDVDNHLSQYDIFLIQTKARYLSIFLALCIELYSKPKMNIRKISQLAIAKVTEFNTFNNHLFCNTNPDETLYTRQIDNPETLERWFRSFKNNNDMFINPYSTKTRERPLPPLLQSNPDILEAFNRFSKENIGMITSETLQRFLVDTAIPETAKKIEAKVRQETSNPNFVYTTQNLLQDNGLLNLHVSTVLRWMHQLKFSYGNRKKCYYVDKHESDENVLYRNEYINRYLEYERRTHRYFLLSIDKFEQMVSEEKLLVSDGMYYKDELNNVEYYEVHVDCHDEIQQMAAHLPYGGNLSKVLFPDGAKPLIIFGQDESIFKQFSFSKKSWTLGDGSIQLLPKDEGQGVMISAFVSREFGYGMQLSTEDLIKINQKRSGKKYSDEEAAILKKGKAMKGALTESPFVKELEYGANGEGYWTYESMILQLEDCIDVVKTLYPQFDFLFTFDHSNGHDRLQPNGLSVSNINLKFGGKQPRMRSSVLTSNINLGPHSPPGRLQHGDIQSMVFDNNHVGPFYLNEAEKEEQKYDKITGETCETYKTRAELAMQLQHEGIDSKGNAKQLRERCEKANIAIKKTYNKVYEGWFDKPKGALQILYERGWIDPDLYKKKKYTAAGKNDEFGTLIKETSINALMKEQHDFLNELTLLQFHGEKLGVTIDRSPKCHPEIAGEGIEYVWAIAKMNYRILSFSAKKNKNVFLQSVRNSTSRTKLTVDMIRKCSKRAHRYMLAYKAYNQVNIEDKKGIAHLSHSLIEKAVKNYKVHRSALDFDAAFLTNLKEMKDSEKETLHKVVKKMSELRACT